MVNGQHARQQRTCLTSMVTHLKEAPRRSSDDLRSTRRKQPYGEEQTEWHRVPLSGSPIQFIDRAHRIASFHCLRASTRANRQRSKSSSSPDWPHHLASSSHVSLCAPSTPREQRRSAGARCLALTALPTRLAPEGSLHGHGRVRASSRLFSA